MTSLWCSRRLPVQSHSVWALLSRGRVLREQCQQPSVVGGIVGFQPGSGGRAQRTVGPRVPGLNISQIVVRYAYKTKDRVHCVLYSASPATADVAANDVAAAVAAACAVATSAAAADADADAATATAATATASTVFKLPDGEHHDLRFGPPVA